MADEPDYLHMTFAELIRRAAHWFGDEDVARFEDGTSLTFTELERRSAKLARILLARGYERGDVGMTWMPNTAEFMVTYLAFARIGMLNALANIRYQATDLANAMEVADPQIVLYGAHEGHEGAEERVNAAASKVPRLADPARVVGVAPADGYSWEQLLQEPAASEAELEAAEARVEPTDLLNIIYTSGTTGNAKGSLNRQGAALKNSYDGGVFDRFDASTRFLLVLPLFHCFGIRGFIAMLQFGGTLVVKEPFEPRAVLDLIEREKVTHTFCVPTHLVKMIEAYEDGGRAQDLSSWQYGLVAGSAVPTDLQEAIEHSLGVTGMASAYGLTEATAAVTQTMTDWSMEDRYATLGCPVPDMELSILDPSGSGEVLAQGETGEICLRGYNVHAGYYRSEHSIVDESGWLHTGDAGRIDADGNLEIRGRYKEMFKSNGLNVYPKEVEAVINSHEAVTESAVVSASDPVRGEVGVAFVRAVPGGTNEDELLAFLKDRIARYKCPMRIEIVDDFPRSFATQKIQKQKLEGRATELLDELRTTGR